MKKDVRKIKVYEQSGRNYKPTPTIMLKGLWLEELGFGAALCKHVERNERNKRRAFVNDNARILHTDKRDKQTDTYGDSMSYARGDCVEYFLS